MTYISKELRDIVSARAENRCEYCRIGQDLRAFRFHVDYIIAEKHDGTTTADNLALSCPKCNAYKGADIGAVDPESRALVFLFNPRTQTWGEHFNVEADGTIVGQTPEGRATAKLLQFNQPLRARQRLEAMQLGLYQQSK